MISHEYPAIAFERCSDLAEPLCAELAPVWELVASAPAPPAGPHLSRRVTVEPSPSEVQSVERVEGVRGRRPEDRLPARVIRMRVPAAQLGPTAYEHSLWARGETRVRRPDTFAE